MNFLINRRDNILIVTIAEDFLEGKKSIDMKFNMMEAAKPNISALLIDLKQVKVVDSTALGALLIAYRQLKNHNIPIILVGVQTFVMELLNITRISDAFNFATTIEKALENIK